MTLNRTLLIGTRGSLLATTQAGHVRDGLAEAGHTAELHIVHTPGDASQAAQTPVEQIGIGVFTETLRTALARGECDIAVHSFKDLPTAADTRFRTVVPRRVDPREVLISVDNRRLLELPSGAKVGTSAPRRVAQVLAVRPDLKLLPLRGNIGTRMGRVGQDLDAVILARAGLERVGQLDRAAESIDPAVIMPAPAQGALSVEVRVADQLAWAAVEGLDHRPSHLRAIAERAVLATLEAGCSAPVAAHATLAEDDSTLTITGGVFALDGSDKLVTQRRVRIPAESWKKAAEAAGADVGRELLGAGADRLMATAR
ncbi:hydroxymethylbilane synthase [Corynebacterium heidelbergense]|uniref:Hydroxymethylbilane synthase n=1 Tax=Corynebacterium heidelbergense TaxID=2055947 RepID=A0A364VEG2_9CORY|nr:hydroxymethylbilane synthase [Corynebacterium heidelbergense]RAV35052.1 hydroxymethylbilane synthase [Corynebacterium heidelbergense]WCZ37396.1 Porphobilinogen deaminase [Corynebacterium heidelbergense]